MSEHLNRLQRRVDDLARHAEDLASMSEDLAQVIGELRATAHGQLPLPGIGETATVPGIEPAGELAELTAYNDRLVAERDGLRDALRRISACPSFFEAKGLADSALGKLAAEEAEQRLGGPGGEAAAE